MWCTGSRAILLLHFVMLLFNLMPHFYPQRQGTLDRVKIVVLVGSSRRRLTVAFGLEALLWPKPLGHKPKTTSLL